MASNYGAALVLAAGTITFANEWLQTDQVNWRVPIATLLGAAVVGGIGSLSPGAANGLGFMVLIAASATQFNGKSAIQEVAGSLPRQKGR